jgi:hypothetical protein
MNSVNGTQKEGAYDVFSSREPSGILRVREDGDVLGPITILF